MEFCLIALVNEQGDKLLMSGKNNLKIALVQTEMDSHDQGWRRFLVLL